MKRNRVYSVIGRNRVKRNPVLGVLRFLLFGGLLRACAGDLGRGEKSIEREDEAPSEP